MTLTLMIITLDYDSAFSSQTLNPWLASTSDRFSGSVRDTSTSEGKRAGESPEFSHVAGEFVGLKFCSRA